MKDGIREIIGKTISGVVVKINSRQPRSQVFLVFTDDTFFEFYCLNSDILGISGVLKGGFEYVKEPHSEHSVIIREFHDGA